MFCKWCGKKIKDYRVPCPYCGKYQDPMESGNGFWDLCETTPDSKRRLNSPAKKKSGSEFLPKNRNEVRAKEKRNTKSVLSVWVAVLGILSCVLLIGIWSCLRTISNNKNEIASLQENVLSLENEYLQTKTELENMVNAASYADTTSNDLTSEVVQLSEDVEDWWLYNKLVTTDEYEIQKFGLEDASDRSVLIVSGIDSEDEISYCWQKSNDLGMTWENVAENCESIIVDDTLTQYRIVAREVCKEEEGLDVTHYYYIVFDEIPSDDPDTGSEDENTEEITYSEESVSDIRDSESSSYNEESSTTEEN